MGKPRAPTHRRQDDQQGRARLATRERGASQVGSTSRKWDAAAADMLEECHLPQSRSSDTIIQQHHHQHEQNEMSCECQGPGVSAGWWSGCGLSTKPQRHFDQGPGRPRFDGTHGSPIKAKVVQSHPAEAVPGFWEN